MTPDMRRIFFAPICLGMALCLFFPRITSAQPAQSNTAATSSAAPEWLLLPIGAESDAIALTSALHQPLRVAGVRAMDAEGGTLAFEEALSTAPQSVSQTELDEWADHSRDALRLLAEGDYDEARTELLQAQAVSERAAEEMNRSAERAREVLDTCLYMARALIETRQRSEALEQVRTCRVLVPRVEPGGFRHPPEVQAMLQRVDAEERRANLEVTSSPSGCMVRINGVPQGQTPFSLENVARGDYRVQVECDEQRGRVHRARVTQDEDAVRVHVDTTFDAAIHTAPFLRAQPGFALEGAGYIAETMRRPVLAIAQSGEHIHLWLIERATRAGAGDLQVTEVRTTPDHLQIAARALKDRHSLDLRYDGPRPLEPMAITSVRPGAPALAATDTALTVVDTDIEADNTEALDFDQPGEIPSWRLGTGLALMAVGLGTIGVATFLHFDRAKTGDFYSQFTSPTMVGYLANQDAWLSTQLGPTAALALGGGAIAALGVGLLVPAFETPQWWAWTLGGVGVLVAGAALLPILTRPDCGDIASVTDGQHIACIDHDMAESQSVLIASAALPLLAIPISALLQSGEQSGNAQQALLPSINLSATELSVSLSGTFE